jgi:broad specificity phosphatase PhoE
VNRPVGILLIRHATNPNFGRGLTGWLPGVSLDEEGRKQADRLCRTARIEAPRRHLFEPS